MDVIKFPTRASVNESSRIITACSRAESSLDALSLDLGACTMMGPFGATYIASCAELRRRQGLKTILCLPQVEKAQAFIAEIGLAHFVETGIRSAHGPLTLHHLIALDPSYTQGVADMLTERIRGMTSENSYPVVLCLNELLQNVFEWSDSKVGCFVLAQYFKGTRSVRLCVVDRGLGIPAVLRRSQVQNIQRLADADTIRLAVTKQRLTSRANQVGGLGLKTIRDTVCGYDGRLTVISSTAKLMWSDQEEPVIKKNPRARLRGTAIAIDFMPHTPFHADTIGDLF